MWNTSIFYPNVSGRVSCAAHVRDVAMRPAQDDSLGASFLPGYQVWENIEAASDR